MRRARFAPQGALAIHAASWGCEFSAFEAKPDLFRQIGTLAVVDIKGPILQHKDWLWDSYEAIRARVESACSSACDTVVLCIDSPGGEVAGCFELSDEIRSKAKAAGKRVIAYVDGQAASAAYALACAAEAIYVPPTGSVGSIGTIRVAVDQTGLDRQLGLTFAVVASGSRKADGNPHVPISEATIGAIQTEVNAMAEVFFELVARARGLEASAVASLEAALFLGASAVKAGLADQVTTFDGLLAMLATGQSMAREGAEAGMNEKEKAIAALRALAASEDEKESANAKAALKAMGVDESEKPKDDEKKDDTKSESDDEKKDDTKSESDDEKKDDDEKEKSDAKASLALAARVQSLTAKFEAKEEAEERAKLMASRPDFAKEVVDLMTRSPLAVVRDAVKNLPKGAAAPKGQVAAARAALTIEHTQGNTQGEAGDHLPEHEAHELDVRMGLTKRTSAIRNEGNKLFLGVMRPAEARAELARREELARKGASK